MTDDDDEVTIDLVDGFDGFDGELVDLLEQERAELESRERERERAAAADYERPGSKLAPSEVTAVTEPPASDEIEESDELPAGFADWTENRRQAWAVEPDLLRAEQRRRYALVDAITYANRPDRRAAVAASSGWEDVSLDRILDQLKAGSLTLPVPTIGMLADGASGLLYEGRVNGLAGESGAGKGWVALKIAIEQMRLGRHAYLLDFEDSPALAVLRLVTVLGAAPELVRNYFHYIHPAHHDEPAIEYLVERVADTPHAFAIIDSTGESIAAAGLNQNADEEVARWMQSLAHPLADKGSATVLLIDHMTKAEDGGLWPIGSQRKRASITGVQLIVEVAKPFSKSADGMVVLKVAKDRHGAREARSVASYVQMRHPVKSTNILPDGTVEMLLSETLEVVFGTGKTVAQAQSDRDAKAAAALAADVAEIDALRPTPKGYRDVKAVKGWRDDRAQAAMRAWREGKKP